MRAGTGRTLGLIALLVVTLAGGARAERGPSTPREREKALKLVHQLEADPFGRKARDARKWLALWVVDVPDFKLQYCPEIFGGPLAARQRIRTEILAQTTYSSLAFLLENPGRQPTDLDIHRAGVLGALRAYEAMLAGEPGTRSPLLDDLITKRNAGELDAYLAETVKSCPGPR
jgi:hypothetical protein